jgi:ABC-2 type transport system permease protein
MKTLVLYGASMRRGVIEMRRYVFDSISGVVTIYGFFLLLFFGAKTFGGGRPGFGDTLAAVIVSFALWAFTTFCLSTLTFELTQEAQLGTLEQLGMSPFGLAQVLLARVLTLLVVYFGIMMLLLVLMMATTGRWLNLAPMSTLPLLVLTIVGVIGLGFVLGGVAIVFKRVTQALQVWQIAVFGLIAAPVNRVPFMKYLPLTWGATLLRRVMVDGVSLTAMPARDVLFLVLNTAFYFALGLFAFKRFEGVARERGLLGHY